MPRSPTLRNARQQAAESLGRVGPLVSRFVERLLAGHEPPLTLAQYLALQAIAQGEGVSAELARQAAVSPAAVSQLVAALHNAHLVESNRATVDRRRQRLLLTDEGERVLQSVRKLLRGRLAMLLSDLEPDEAVALAHSLQRLEVLLTGNAPPPRPGLRPKVVHQMAMRR